MNYKEFYEGEVVILVVIFRMKDKLVNVLLFLIFNYEFNFMVIIIFIIGAFFVLIFLSLSRFFRNFILFFGCLVFSFRFALCFFFRLSVFCIMYRFLTEFWVSRRFRTV